jgi:cobalt/nickel transport protein
VIKTLIVALALSLGTASVAMAHFGMVIPSKASVSEKKDAALTLDISFSHPMEMVGMDMEKPDAFAVIIDGKKQDLLPSLRASKVMDKAGWQANFSLQRPAVYQFILSPKPYWEPAEDCYIVHYTKTYVAAFGEEEGWDVPAGLKTEIVPLTRPFGNYAGNVFQGQVLLNGKPVPYATVEVELYNKNKVYTAPNEYMVTQVVKADQNGVFTYGVPFAGWWGFAALNTDTATIDHEGKPKAVELGAVLWARFDAPEKSK